MQHGKNVASLHITPQTYKKLEVHELKKLLRATKWTKSKVTATGQKPTVSALYLQTIYTLLVARVLNLPVTLPASNLPVIYRKITGKLPVAHTLYV